MKLAIAIASADALPSAFVVWRGFESSIEKAAALGYHGVELALKRTEEIDRDRLRGWLDAAGIEVSCISTGQVFAALGLMMTDPDPRIRREVRVVLSGFIDLAAEFGGRVNLGRVRGRIGDWPRAEAEQRFIELAWELCDRAEAKGVTLLIEPVNRYEIDFINRVDEGAALMRRINRVKMKLMPDIFHMNIEDVHVGATLERYISDIGYVHFADSNRLAPGQGHTDFDAIFRHLAQARYNGWTAVEILPRPDPDTAARQAAEFLLPRIEHCNRHSFVGLPAGDR